MDLCGCIGPLPSMTEAVSSGEQAEEGLDQRWTVSPPPNNLPGSKQAALIFIEYDLASFINQNHG